MKLSPRLEQLAFMVDPSTTLVDIGSDHGLIPRWLVRNHHKGSIYATELSNDTFRSLHQSLKDEPIKVYQADGLKHLPNDVQTLLISGMGGQLIASFLQKLPDYPQVQTVILGPQRDSYLVRTTLALQGFIIIDEVIVEEKHHFYPLIKARKHASSYELTMVEAYLGPMNIKHRHPSFLKYLSFLSNDLAKKPKLDSHQQTLLEWINLYVKH
jgi:tRNA (adenine22-N1)-methyltransferase